MEDKFRYPIGKFTAPEDYSTEYLSKRIQEIAEFPTLLKKKCYFCLSYIMSRLSIK